MIVDDRLVVEVKSTPGLPPTAVRQLYGYLRATDLELGLLLHFGPEPKFYRQIVTNDQKPFNTDQKTKHTTHQERTTP
jgi:GxxExxY protein